MGVKRSSRIWSRRPGIKGVRICTTCDYTGVERNSRSSIRLGVQEFKDMHHLTEAGSVPSQDTCFWKDLRARVAEELCPLGPLIDNCGFSLDQ